MTLPPSDSATSNDRLEAVREMVVHALGSPAERITLIADQGNVNTAYEVVSRGTELIVRVRFYRGELGQFLREQQCAKAIRATHDWTPAVLFVGTHGNHSFSIQEKVHGIVASRYSGDLAAIWEQIGEHAAFFHQIETPGYLRDVFEPQSLQGKPWCEPYVSSLGEAKAAQLVQRGFLTEGEFLAALESIRQLATLRFKPTLAHGNLSLSNIIVDRVGKAHIIDWGTCEGHMAIERDLAELLAFDVPADHVRAYLRGHRLPDDYVAQHSELLARLQLVRCFVNAHWLCESRSAREADLARYVRKAKECLPHCAP